MGGMKGGKGGKGGMGGMRGNGEREWGGREKGGEVCTSSSCSKLLFS